MPQGLVGEYVRKFIASGLSDALYTQEGDDNARVGSCITLSNLIPDRHTKGVYAPRPAYTTGFDASTAPGLTITAPGKVTFATAPLTGAILTWTDDNTVTPQSLGTGDGVTTVFSFIKNGNPYQAVNPKVYDQDWQGNQLQYATPRTNVAVNNVATSGFQVGSLNLNTDATGGPDGSVSVYGQEGSTTTNWELASAFLNSTVASNDFYTFVIDMKLTPGYTNGENVVLLQFFNLMSSSTPSAKIDIAANTVLSTTGPVTAAFVASLPNGFSRFSFVIGPCTNVGGTPYVFAALNNNVSFIGDNATKFYFRLDAKKTQTISSWIKNTTSAAITVTDYQLTNTSVGTQIGNISAQYVLGSRVYGMCLGNNGGTYFDAPFCYDFSTGAFVTISGITTANVPKSTGYPNGSGSGGVVAADWVAPQMQLIGSKIIVTHYGFAGTGNFIGVIDVSNPAAPAWSSGNLSGAGGLSFTVPPVAVTQFNGRAYYAVGGNANSNNVIFSDSLNPTVCTNASQVLTIGDNTPILGFGQQPYASSTVGGIIQSILTFKASSIAQITGDPTTSNLSVSVIATGVGCRAPQTIASTPLGCMFMAAEGIRYVDMYGEVKNPLPSVRNPFSNCNNISASCFPTTACAAYNSNMYRISLYTTDLIGNIYRQEYVFDLEYGWHGPHIYDAAPAQTGVALISAYASQFLIVNRLQYPSTAAKNNTTANLSTLYPGPFDAFVESGVNLAWSMLSCAFPDEAPMLIKVLEEATLSYNPGNVSSSINVSLIPTPVGTSQQLPPSQSATLAFTPLGSLWGSVIWGQFTWGGSGQTSMTESTVPFQAPTTYKDAQLSITGTSALNQRIGPFSYRGIMPGATNMDLR